MQSPLPRTLAPCVALVAGIGLALVGAIGTERVAYAVETPAAPADLFQVDRARAAYDRGVRAHAVRDHVTAARAFAEADALAPAPASLEAALESVMRADDALLGAELVDRAEGRAGDAGVARSLEAARKRFAGRTGKVKVDCRLETRCVASVDGAPADARKAIYVIAGPHAVVVQRGEERFERLVEVKADATVTVSASEEGGGGGVGAGAGAGGSGGPGGPGGESGTGTGTGTSGGSGSGEASQSGISPVWFYVGVGATAVLAGATVLSGLDAVKKHDGFESGGCANGGSGPLPVDCEERGRNGETAQLRTNLLLGATAVLAATTVAVGIFAVRWKDGTRARVTVGTQRSAAIAGFELTTP